MQRHQKVRPTSTEEKELEVDFLKTAQDRESVKAKKKKKKKKKGSSSKQCTKLIPILQNNLIIFHKIYRKLCKKLKLFIGLKLR